MPSVAAPDPATRYRRRRRLVLTVGLVAMTACFAMAFATLGGGPGVARERALGVLEYRESGRAGPHDASGRSSSQVPAVGPRPVAPARAKPLRVRVVSDGSPVAGAIVRVVEFDRSAHLTLPRSEAARTSLDGVADLRIDDDLSAQAAWIEVAVVGPRGLRHGYERLAEAVRRGDDEVEIPVPGAGRLEIHIEGLPVERMPEYVDVRFLTPDGGWEGLFKDLPATPVEDGGLFETRAIPRVQRVRLRADGRGEVPEVPGDHGIYVEFPANPDGWLVEATEFSGCSAPANPGEVCRIAAGTTGVYRVHFRRAPSVRVRIEDVRAAPIAAAEIAVGVRHAKGGGAVRVFDTTSTTDASGAIELPLWTGSRLPDWTPIGLVIVAYAAGYQSRVTETEGGWYASDVTIRLEKAEEGSFVLEGTLTHADGKRAAGVPVRIVAAAPWNGDAALPALRATTVEDGGWRIEVPEAYRPVFAYGRGLRLDVDSERLEATPTEALWRRLHPDLPRSRIAPERFDLPAPGSTTRHDGALVAPPP